jgi:hypothetical protein
MFSKYMGIVMSLVYILLGLAIIFRGAILFKISPAYAVPMGSLFIVYGLFRAYRIYRNFFQQ